MIIKVTHELRDFSGIILGIILGHEREMSSRRSPSPSSSSPSPSSHGHDILFLIGFGFVVCCWSYFQEPTLEDILSEQTGEFAHERDSVAAAGKAISRSKKAVRTLNEETLNSSKAKQNVWGGLLVGPGGFSCVVGVTI